MVSAYNVNLVDIDFNDFFSLFLPKCKVKNVAAMSIYKLLLILRQHLTLSSI